MIVRLTFFISIIALSILSLGSFLVTRAYFSDTAVSENISFTTAQDFNNDSSNPEDDQNPPETPDSTPSGKIIINEVFQHSSTGSQEWIELFNSGGSSVDISGWKIADKDLWEDSKSDTILSSPPIEPGKYVVIVTNNSSVQNIPDDAVIIRLTGNTIGSGLNVSSENVYLINSEGEVVDKMGYGSNNLFGGNSPSAPSSEQSVQRISDGHDTDQASDWKVGVPSLGKANQ